MYISIEILSYAYSGDEYYLPPLLPGHQKYPNCLHNIIRKNLIHFGKFLLFADIMCKANRFEFRA